MANKIRLGIIGAGAEMLPAADLGQSYWCSTARTQATRTGRGVRLKGKMPFFSYPSLSVWLSMPELNLYREG